MSKPYFVWYQRGEWANRCYVEASASRPGGETIHCTINASALNPSAETMHARVECRYPDDPVAVELCRSLAKRRAEYLLDRR